jgi:hypothetical protein
MTPYILPTFLIIFEIIFFIYLLARDNNENFRKYVENKKKETIRKIKLNVKTDIKEFSKKDYTIFFVVVFFTFFLDNKMVIVVLVTLSMIVLLRLRISYEKFEEIFENYAPSIRKYNIYLGILLSVQILIIILTVICIK